MCCACRVGARGNRKRTQIHVLKPIADKKYSLTAVVKKMNTNHMEIKIV